MKRLVSWIVAIWMTLVAVCAGYAAVLDYTDAENWAVWGNGKTRAADVFFCRADSQSQDGWTKPQGCDGCGDAGKIFGGHPHGAGNLYGNGQFLCAFFIGK